MNLLLLFKEDFIDPANARISGRRQAHLLQIKKSVPGDAITVGLAGGDIGIATIVNICPDFIGLHVVWQYPPPPPLPLILIIALPRPKMLKRILQTCASMGAKEIYFINAFKVEKSFWQTPWLTVEKLQENLVLGLEQGIDTRLPQIHIRKKFKPFVEDELTTLSENTLKLVAHPGAGTACPRHIKQMTTLLIGPEGGFIDYEITKLTEYGFQPVDIGPRILRVETAVTALLSRF